MLGKGAETDENGHMSIYSIKDGTWRQGPPVKVDSQPVSTGSHLYFFGSKPDDTIQRLCTASNVWDDPDQFKANFNRVGAAYCFNGKNTIYVVNSAGSLYHLDTRTNVFSLLGSSIISSRTLYTKVLMCFYWGSSIYLVLHSDAIYGAKGAVIALAASVMVSYNVTSKTLQPPKPILRTSLYCFDVYVTSSHRGDSIYLFGINDKIKVYSLARDQWKEIDSTSGSATHPLRVGV
eukprot:gene5681-6562_t